ncbi:hypothetical protein, partial [Cytobacillus oceanisediminis]|uniref:hypothetical protein n=1 Tax=Cytobacillus oceanisediminis TaxID=665099 RepID=UPI001C93197A
HEIINAQRIGTALTKNHNPHPPPTFLTNHQLPPPTLFNINPPHPPQYPYLTGSTPSRNSPRKKPRNQTTTTHYLFSTINPNQYTQPPQYHKPCHPST